MPRNKKTKSSRMTKRSSCQSLKEFFVPIVPITRLTINSAKRDQQTRLQHCSILAVIVNLSGTKIDDIYVFNKEISN